MKNYIEISKKDFIKDYKEIGINLKIIKTNDYVLVIDNEIIISFETKEALKEWLNENVIEENENSEWSNEKMLYNFFYWDAKLFKIC